MHRLENFLKCTRAGESVRLSTKENNRQVRIHGVAGGVMVSAREEQDVESFLVSVLQNQEGLIFLSKINCGSIVNSFVVRVGWKFNAPFAYLKENEVWKPSDKNFIQIYRGYLELQAGFKKFASKNAGQQDFYFVDHKAILQYALREVTVGELVAAAIAPKIITDAEKLAEAEDKLQKAEQREKLAKTNTKNILMFLRENNLWGKRGKAMKEAIEIFYKLWPEFKQ